MADNHSLWNYHPHQQQLHQQCVKKLRWAYWAKMGNQFRYSAMVSNLSLWLTQLLTVSRMANEYQLRVVFGCKSNHRSGIALVRLHKLFIDWMGSERKTGCLCSCRSMISFTYILPRKVTAKSCKHCQTKEENSGPEFDIRPWKLTVNGENF